MAVFFFGGGGQGGIRGHEIMNQGQDFKFFLILYQAAHDLLRYKWTLAGGESISKIAMNVFFVRHFDR